MYMQKYKFKTVLFKNKILVHCIIRYRLFAIAKIFLSFFVNNILVWRFSIILLVNKHVYQLIINDIILQDYHYWTAV